ncbi:peptidoglycan-N-acetylglucosamine deacetylase [Azospirillaceae bacterium]
MLVSHKPSPVGSLLLAACLVAFGAFAPGPVAAGAASSTPHPKPVQAISTPSHSGTLGKEAAPTPVGKPSASRDAAKEAANDVKEAAPVPTGKPSASRDAAKEPTNDPKDAVKEVSTSEKPEKKAAALRMKSARYVHAPLIAGTLTPGGSVVLSERIVREAGENILALTIDDGPEPIYDTEIIRILAEHNAVATFFLVGRNAARFPELVKAMVDGGNEVGNHSWSHPMLPSLLAQEQVDQIRKTNDIISTIIGKSVRWFRPPYGGYGNQVTSLAHAEGLDTIMWTTDTQDWTNISPQQIVDRAADHLTPGAVILLHSTRRNTVLALPQIIEQAHAQNFRFVTMTEWKNVMSRLEPKAIAANAANSAATSVSPVASTPSTTETVAAMPHAEYAPNAMGPLPLQQPSVFSIRTATPIVTRAVPIAWAIRNKNAKKNNVPVFVPVAYLQASALPPPSLLAAEEATPVLSESILPSGAAPLPTASVVAPAPITDLSVR